MVKWSDPAKKSLRQIYYFIAEDSEYYTKEVIDKIVADSEKLADFPKLGRTVPELDNEKIRELIIYSYRLFSEIVNGDIDIIALVHGKRKFPEDLA